MGLWNWLRGKSEHAAGRDRADRRNRIVSLAGDGYFEFEIVGESHYQKALNRLAGPRTDESAEFYCTAFLKPEPKNPYDSNAIAVTIRGSTVGYLGREVAVQYRSDLEALGLPPHTVA